MKFSGKITCNIIFHIKQNKVIIKAKSFKWTSRGNNITVTTARSTTVDMEKISCYVPIVKSIIRPKRAISWLTNYIRNSYISILNHERNKKVKSKAI